MHLNVAIVVASALVLASCATPYAPPPNVPTAVLNLSTTFNGTRVQAFDNDKCAESPNGLKLAYFFMNTADPLSGVDKLIPTDKEFVYTFAGKALYGSYGQSCIVTLAFKPVPNTRYVSKFTVQGNQCVATLHRVVLGDSGERLVPENSVRQIEPTCHNNMVS